MKTTFSILILLFSLTAMSQNQFTKKWQQVDSLSGIGQSQSALDIVFGIYNQAKSANQTDQFVKASLYRMKLESDYEEDYFEKSIARTELEIQSAQAPVKQILHSILAELYWRYYQNNRWQILSRSETSGFTADDIKTWDLKKLVTACMENYTLSLTDKELLKNTPITSYSEILEKQKDSEKFRPTLFDFLAHRAIDFYSSSEAGLTKPANTFLMDKAEYFTPSAEFTALRITSPDAFAFEFQALLLLQEAVRFHSIDKDPTALIDADMERLSFVHKKSILPEKDSLYLSALYLLEKRFKNHPSSTEIAFEIASRLNGDEDKVIPFNDENENRQPVSDAKKWDKKKAIEVCEAAIVRFPESFGATNCRSLIESIKQPLLSVTTNYAVIPGKLSLGLVNYKNVKTIYFRLLKINPETDRGLREKQQEVRLEKYLGMKAEKSWEQALPDDDDYRNHSTEIRIPALKAGYYVLLSSNDPDFPDKGAIIAAATFWASNISYLSRNENGNNEIVVLNRESGQPLAGIKVQVFYREYNSNSRKYDSKSGGGFATDKSGMMNIPSKKDNKRNNQFYLVFSSKKDQLITESYFSNYSYPDNEPKTIVQTRFFTDRAIYRPGQTIYFKGIVLERKEEDVQLKIKTETEVAFYDANGQVISKQTLTTNDFGSFSGNFIAPQGVLTGQMTIRCETGSVSVQVEEYKRPKFEVTFEPVKGSYKLGETIVSRGKALAYAGSSVSDAKVSYRVVRNASFPYWWGWRGMPTSAEMEITNGETTTESDGTFTVTFKAIPDLSVDRKTDPVFNYTVYADVADINGESHSSETGISVGYKALLIKTDLADDINLEKNLQFSLTTTNLNGEKEAASGAITISKLRKPSQVLYSRKWAKPDMFTMTKSEFEKDFPGEVYKDEDDVTTWPIESTVFSANFSTPADSVFKVGNQIQAGVYVVEIRTKDAFGEVVLYKKYFNTFQPESAGSDAVSPAFFSLLTPTAEPGKDVKFIIGSPVKNAYIIYEVIHKDIIVSREILTLSKEQRLISIPVKEEYRGNFGISLAFVKNNRTFAMSKVINVPYTNKKLDISFATFRNKLQPGQEEEWQITLRDSKGEKAVAEMLAGMYDASLDAFVPHSWSFDIFNSYYGIRTWSDNRCFGTEASEQYVYPESNLNFINREYNRLNWFGFNFGYSGGRMRNMAMSKSVAMDAAMKSEKSPPPPSPPGSSIDKKESKGENNELLEIAETVYDNEISPDQKPVTSQNIQIRKDFNETAFFFPQLATNENGEIVLNFKAPEALTRWKMMGLAYTKDLKYGQIEKTLVTQKDLMLFTNPPRFLREGDKMDFSAKISNISDRDLSGTAELHFFDALTMKLVDEIMGLTQSNIPFSVNKGLSSPVGWKIIIPEGLQAVVYRITATAGTFSDGEEAAIPVLTNRMLVTESMPLPVNGMQKKKFAFEKLVNSGKAGSTLRNYRLTLEYTSNPAWYAVQALPYLMEYPYECAEQIFSRYYANSLATHIANSDPKIKRVFESWKNITPDALKSNLEKNEELKSVLLQESPWVREATNESERKHRIALLFDLNRMASEQTSALKKLRDMQNPNGGWPWFQGMPESRYITQHIVTGLGHLYFLEALNPVENTEIHDMLQKAVEYLDETVKVDFEKLKKNDKDYLKNNHLGYEDIQYLYARTYFLADFPIGKDNMEVLAYFKNQSVKYWKTQNNYMKAMIALYLNRFGEENTASLIMRSLKETSLHNEEMGMYWRNEQRGWNWYQAPIETQALLIEAFDEVNDDQNSVEEMKMWLLKQKQTQDWKTTKATTEAVYALLMQGTSQLVSDKHVEITVGNEKVDPYELDELKPEAGTGYFKTSWDASAIKPEMGKVTVNNLNPTVAWGSLYWQYFEQLDKITPAKTPLSLSKKLFREVNTPTGPVIEPITEASLVKVGDKIVVRVELRSDRDMEYIHLKDMRASAFEPVNVLSGYNYQDGLGYYESTRDASTNFFIGYLPKGTYVFEYKLVATQKGEFSNGITSAQCMYAPEFSAHSEGIRVKVE
ncbi:MAG: alpha-2-macroglobulin family protein [Bacteroidales bacterium]|nr:alpha-2-macroglobulin family protein [Bacteroidales bacterium]